MKIPTPQRPTKFSITKTGIHLGVEMRLGKYDGNCHTLGNLMRTTHTSMTRIGRRNYCSLTEFLDETDWFDELHVTEEIWSNYKLVYFTSYDTYKTICTLIWRI